MLTDALWAEIAALSAGLAVAVQRVSDLEARVTALQAQPPQFSETEADVLHRLASGVQAHVASRTALWTAFRMSLIGTFTGVGIGGLLTATVVPFVLHLLGR